ncbi:hypothetical protein QT327_00975 [Olivibacter sp. 47]|uniref:hypothetical protein n=1 Tax=Olivibacter sp. 47 TaxID=3056486 RepID=UPI0025A34D42|nr:hypothetical protein [Olivibacter sp. 47]MDM8172929.1 hypothetical protein [Olivibacter sp. 47]
MANITVQPPLSNVQMELLKLFCVDIPENELLELKSMMVKFLLERARDSADAIWDKKGYSDEKLKKILDSK